MKHPKTWSILASLGMVVAVCMTLPTPTVSAPMVDQAQSETDAAIYSNERFTELVKKYSVNNGEQLDYAAWQNSPEDLAALTYEASAMAKVNKTMTNPTSSGTSVTCHWFIGPALPWPQRSTGGLHPWLYQLDR